MKRRTLLHNLFASMVAAPVLGVYEKVWAMHSSNLRTSVT